MKNLFITFILAAIMTIFAWFTCAAQTNVEQQFSRFEKMAKNDKSIVTSSQNVTYHEGMLTTGSCSMCEFKIASGNTFVNDMLSAMSADESEAYHSAASSAGNKGVTYAIAYGTGKNDYQLIGVDPSYNFKVVCFKNKDHNDYRTSYAIEWKQDDNGYYTGKLCKIYGMKPDKMISNNDKEISVYKIDTLINMSINKGLEASLKQLKGLNGKNIKVYSSDLNGMNNLQWPLDDEIDEASDWLSDFGIYYNEFKEKAKGSVSKGVVYATELLNICKRAGNLLNKDERKLCIETLKECKSYCKDKYVNGLLDQAINHLSGKYKEESYSPTQSIISFEFT